MEADLVKRTGVPYQAIPAAGIHGVGWRSLPGNLWQLWRGFLGSRRILAEFRPDVFFFTGGYLAVPMAFASRIPFKGLPRPRSLLFVPDIEPGLALKTLARFADRIALTVDASRKYMPTNANLTVTGYPTRSDLSSWDRQTAYMELQLENDLPVLLVFGGSSGARSINRALLAWLPKLLDEMQVVHITGKLDWPEVEAAWQEMKDTLPVSCVRRYRFYPYLHEQMGAALASADLVLSRAGASILGEYPLLGLPAILVPYPYAWRYQQINARYLEKRGAAVVVQDADLPDQLFSSVHGLITDRQKMADMSLAMRALAKPQAAQHIAALLGSLASDRRGAG
jgi:UDP-N-acetylglucosamine--N-acetylmuramyl-(pentapeptide) pyrophosphoryl-undecaprenol N-acetylglucosamine transferase